MYKPNLNVDKIFALLVEINEGELLKYGGKALNLMAQDMYQDELHPSWRWIE